MAPDESLLQVSRLRAYYGSALVVEDAEFSVGTEPVALIGRNGAGKTTLLRILMGEEAPSEGEAQRGHLVEFGYLDQHLSGLPEDKPVLQAVWPQPDPDLTEQKMRDLLVKVATGVLFAERQEYSQFSRTDSGEFRCGEYSFL